MNKKLEPCPFCGVPGEYLFTMNYCDTKIFIDLNGATVRIFDEEMPGYLDSFEIDYCPKCSRGLHENTRPEARQLSVEELEQMDGEPVWVDNFLAGTSSKYDKDEWALVYTWQERAESTTTMFQFDDYGKTWLAFTGKPREEVK